MLKRGRWLHHQHARSSARWASPTLARTWRRSTVSSASRMRRPSSTSPDRSFGPTRRGGRSRHPPRVRPGVVRVGQLLDGGRRVHCSVVFACRQGATDAAASGATTLTFEYRLAFEAVAEGRRRGMKTLDELVDEASMDSFPASDPPPFWGRGAGETARARAGKGSQDKAPDPELGEMSGKSGHDLSRRHDHHPDATGGRVPRASRT
jgi:hypothetical protein